MLSLLLVWGVRLGLVLGLGVSLRRLLVGIWNVGRLMH